MSPSQPFRIQTEAAEALAEWKAFFAEQVATHAKGLAKASDAPGLITLDHYRQAATHALQSLAVAVQDTSSNDDQQRAA